MVITSARVVAHVAVPLFAADDRKDKDTFAMKVSMRSRGLVRSHDYHERPYNSWGFGMAVWAEAVPDGY